MKAILGMGVFFLTTLALGVSAAARNDSFNINAAKISTERDAVNAKNALFLSKTGSVIAADSVSFNGNDKSNGSWPYLINLSGFTTIHGKDMEISSVDGGRYYPELDSLVVKSFTQVTPMAISVVSTGCTNSGQIQVTYSNGMSITADQVCTSSGTYGCQGGNVVKLKAASSCS